MVQLTRPEQLKKLLQDLKDEHLVLDTETTGLDVFCARPVAIQFKRWGKPSWFFVDLREHPEAWAPALALLQDMRVIGHNLAFDWKVLAHFFGVRLQHMYDTMLAQMVLDRGAGDGYSLEEVATRHGYAVSKEARPYFFELDRRPEWYHAFPDQVIAYMRQDVTLPEQIARAQMHTPVYAGLRAIIELENRVIPVIAAMELHGVAIDVQGYRDFIEEKRKEAADLEAECVRVFGHAVARARIERYDRDILPWKAWEEARLHFLQGLRARYDPACGLPWGAYKQQQVQQWRESHPQPKKPRLPYKGEYDPGRFGEAININSPAQMMDAFKALRIDVRNTSEEELHLHEESFPELRALVQYKKKQKIISMAESFLKHQHPVTSRVHSSIRQIVRSGRMASSNPNVQNIPARGEDGKALRSFVVAPPGYRLVICDYPGIEDRILCHLSGDPEKARIFKEGLDPHGEVACLLFDLAPEQVRDEAPGFNGITYRELAKATNYRLQYGGSPMLLARRLRITQERALELYTRYFTVFAGTRDYIKQCESAIEEHCQAETLAGRVRVWERPERHDCSLQEYRRRRAKMLREGVNHKVQGTCADIIKHALCALWAQLPQTVKIILAVHDEIVLEAPEALAEDSARTLARVMQQAAEDMLDGFPVPCGPAVVAQYWKKG